MEKLTLTAEHNGVTNVVVIQYFERYEPFGYYISTENGLMLRKEGLATIEEAIKAATDLLEETAVFGLTVGNLTEK